MVDTNKNKQLDTIKTEALPDVSYKLEQTYRAIPGTIVKVVLEFPDVSGTKSAIIELDDVMTVSYSSYRVKVPVITLGQNSVGGYALGARTVAGSMIRAVFMTDKISAFQTECYLATQEELVERLNNLDDKMPSGVPLKDKVAFMKDDLTRFNIHTIAIAENVTEFDVEQQEYKPVLRHETIMDAVIINNGQTYSVEDLLTESTFSFQARAVRTSSDPTQYSRGFSNGDTFKSISSLL